MAEGRYWESEALRPERVRHHSTSRLSDIGCGFHCLPIAKKRIEKSQRIKISDCLRYAVDVLISLPVAHLVIYSI